ncbi:hypothetical protein [Campylobacter jejuni]|uniref:hypothetical protein n=1 Tax=Campylobacter jejuni TaxID=197 RepID=UPI00207C13C9|nr:hypothetical protein [Campylobacter jejuni]
MFGGLTLSPISLSANLLKTPPLISKWAECNVNCGTKCPVKVHTQDGIIKLSVLIMKVNDSFDNRQARACIRGRSSRYKVYNANRLKRSLKRVGKRGEGKFLCLFLGNKLLMKFLPKCKKLKKNTAMKPFI